MRKITNDEQEFREGFGSSRPINPRFDVLLLLLRAIHHQRCWWVLLNAH